MSNDPKVTFKVELDDSAVRGQLNGIVNNLTNSMKSKNVTVNIHANASSAQGMIDKVSGQLNGLNGKSVEATINADNSAAVSSANVAEDKLNDINGEVAEATIAADNTAAEKAGDETISKLSTIDSTTATATITADNSAAIASIDEVEQKLNGLDGKSSNTSTSNSDSSSGVGGRIKDTASSLFERAWDLGKTYNYSRAKASTLMPGVDMNAWDAAVMGLSSKYGQSASSYNEAAYNARSAGVAQENVIPLLESSSRLAIGGFSDVPTVMDMITNVGNAYGSNSYDDIANTALIAQNYGKISDLGELAHAVPMTAASAHGAGVSYQNLLAAYAAITHSGVLPNVASTQINGMVNELSKTGSTGQKTLAAAAKGTPFEGMSFAQMMTDGGASLYDVASMISAYGQKKGLSYADMFSNATAGYGVQNLLGSDNGETFNTALQEMTDKVDAVTPAFDSMAETVNMEMDVAVTSLENGLINLFTAIAPAILKFVDVLNSENFQNMLSMVIEKFSAWLESDSFMAFVNALSAAAEFLVGLVSGDITLGDMFHGVIDSLIRGIESLLPDWITGKKKNKKEEEPNQGTQGHELELVPHQQKNVVGDVEWIDSAEGLTSSVDSLNSNVSSASDGMSSVSTVTSTLATEANTAKSNMTRVSSALSSLASAVSSINVPSSISPSPMGTIPGRSIGDSLVTHDYVAMLHKGEMVLTASQASTYRNMQYSTSNNYAGIDYDALADSMSKLSLNVNGKRFSRAIERDMSYAQGARYSNVSRRG